MAFYGFVLFAAVCVGISSGVPLRDDSDELVLRLALRVQKTESGAKLLFQVEETPPPSGILREQSKPLLSISKDLTWTNPAQNETSPLQTTLGVKNPGKPSDAMTIRADPTIFTQKTKIPDQYFGPTSIHQIQPNQPQQKPNRGQPSQSVPVTADRPKMEFKITIEPNSTYTVNRVVQRPNNPPTDTYIVLPSQNRPLPNDENFRPIGNNQRYQPNMGQDRPLNPNNDRPQPNVYFYVPSSTDQRFNPRPSYPQTPIAPTPMPSYRSTTNRPYMGHIYLPPKVTDPSEEDTPSEDRPLSLPDDSENETTEKFILWDVNKAVADQGFGVLASRCASYGPGLVSDGAGGCTKAASRFKKKSDGRFKSNDVNELHLDVKTNGEIPDDLEVVSLSI